MPSKTEFYRQMTEQVSTRLVGSWQEWAGFLTTAARLYKYPYHEQLMIYAQRPDATACAEYDLWNDRMGRYVRRGSKGIALVDDSGDGTRQELIEALTEMRGYLGADETELLELTDSALKKLSAMTDEAFAELELYPDFDSEDNAYDE